MPGVAQDNMISARSYLASRHHQGPSLAQPADNLRPFSPFASLHSTPFTTGNEDRLAVNSGNNNSDTVTMSAAVTKRPEASPPRAMVTPAQTAAPSTPVQIPIRPKSRDIAHPPKQQRHHAERKQRSMWRRPKDVHSPDAVPPSVAALLAITNIPPPKATRSMRQTKAEKRMTVESIIERAQESEKELSLKLSSRGPLDILLAAPEDLEADDVSVCGSAPGSVISAQTVSLESMPSLSDSFTTDTLSSLGSPRTPDRKRRIQPTRRSLEPVSSPPGELESHPLSSPDIELEALDFRVFESREGLADKKTSRLPFKPLKSAFKSNLTASLRALRQAARSFSNLNFSSIPPEDFLTRSILTIDPQVPYTDERRPPPLEEEPTAAMRRYLNPTTTARLGKPEAMASGPALRNFTASIQMQTYKIHRAGSILPSGRPGYPSVGPTSAATQASQASQPARSKPSVAEWQMPGPRQREVRENPDFIRIAVMEMAMRRNGKLDDQRPGRARWALPPRKPNTKQYDIGPDGVPARWIPITR